MESGNKKLGTETRRHLKKLIHDLKKSDLAPVQITAVTEEKKEIKEPCLFAGKLSSEPKKSRNSEATPPRGITQQLSSFVPSSNSGSRSKIVLSDEEQDKLKHLRNLE